MRERGETKVTLRGRWSLRGPLSPGDTFELTCDGQTYDVVVAGNGNFTPAHDVDSRRIFVPTWFGEGTVTITNTVTVTGQEDVFVEPPLHKGNATRDRRTSTTCTYATTFSFPDEETGALLIGAFSGSVGGFHTPAR